MRERWQGERPKRHCSGQRNEMRSGLPYEAPASTFDLKVSRTELAEQKQKALRDLMQRQGDKTAALQQRRAASPMAMDWAPPPSQLQRAQHEWQGLGF